ncbi:MAG: hypothetical protein WBP79_00875 [Candidatus Acidiferrales bacterium]
MRGKDYNAGLRGVLFEAQHYARMGAAVWLYGWLVLRQTHQSEGIGWVLGGKPVSYREIEEETGFNRRTLEAWMRTLRRGGYIQTDALPGGIAIRIMKAKKFAQGLRKSAERVRENAWGLPQNRVANASYHISREQVAGRICSSSLADKKERATSTPAGSVQGQIPTQPQRPKQNPQQINSIDPRAPSSGASYAEYIRRALLRMDRDEAVKRELAVGAGPEVRR